MLNDILNICIIPAILLLFIIIEANRKKRPTDAINTKISSNLKEYEKQMEEDQ